MLLLPRHRSVIFGVLGLLVLIAILYGPSVRQTFLSDDYDWLTHAETNLQTGDIWRPFVTPSGGNFYRPLPVMSFNFDSWVAGRNVVWFHLDQLILFALVCLSIVWLVAQLTSQAGLGWLTGLLFAAYPSHHEVVTWLAGRPDLLAALFMVTSTAAMLRFLTTKQQRWWGLGAATTALAFMSKESALILPALHLLAYAVFAWRQRPWSWRQLLMILWPSVVLLGLVLVVRHFVLSGAIGGYLVGGDAVGLNIHWRDLLAPLTSVAMLVNVPYLQYVLGTGSVLSAVLSHAAVIRLSGAVVALGLLVFVWWRRRNSRGSILTALLWVLITFIPVLGLSSSIGSDLEGSRLFFTPSIGYCLLLALVIFALVQSLRNRIVWAGIITLVLLTFGLLNGRPWATAAKEVSFINGMLRQQKNALIMDHPTDAVVSGLPGRYFGAYEFWGPHIVRGVVHDVLASNLNIEVAGVTPSPTSPFCPLTEHRVIALLRWDTQAETWLRLTDLEQTLKAGSDMLIEATWTKDQGPWSMSAAGQYSLPLPGRVLGTTARYLHVQLSGPITTTTFGGQRATVTWRNGASTVDQSLPYTVPIGASSFTIPLCQYMNWATSQDIHDLRVRPPQTHAAEVLQVGLSSFAL